MNSAPPESARCSSGGRGVHRRTVYRSMHLHATAFVCRQCGLAKPSEDFRRRHPGRDVRIRQCRSCHAQSERLRRQAKRSRSRRQEINRMLSRLKRAKSERQVVTICEEMIEGFRGVDGLFRSWRAALDQDLPQGGFAALRHIDAVLRLIQHCESGQLPATRHSYE